MICMETVKFPLFSCAKCNKMIGCYECCIIAGRCPQCRDPLPDNAPQFRGMEGFAEMYGFKQSSDAVRPNKKNQMFPVTG